MTVWAWQAEVCKAYPSKGRGVRMVGRLKQDRWADPEGKNHSKVQVIAEHVESKPRFKNKPEDQEHDPEQEDDPFRETEPAPVEAAAAL